ncbi:MAG: dTMP kinase [Phycisphaerae bacterium]|jgi:dTMP kinase|nr:dTMP kinase [Phycisphaerae bacterium]
MSNLADTLAGKFIVIDGPDGAGKTTQAKLLAEFLTNSGLDVQRIRDPGGTAIGDEIRTILLDNRHHRMNVQCELMLYMASRAQLAQEIIAPALAAGKCVLGDRYISSTIAYQGAGGADVEAITQAARIAVGTVMPDLTVILDIDSEIGLARAAREGQADRIESKQIEYHRKVRELFLCQAQSDPHHFAVIPADGSIDQIQLQLRDTLQTWNWT